jgi:hypothetical protein
MSNDAAPNPMPVLRKVRDDKAPTIPDQLLEAVLSTEMLVQFEDDRPAAVQRIGELVRATLDRQDLDNEQGA